MAKANQKKTRRKKTDRGAKKGAKPSRATARPRRSGAKRAAKDRLAAAQTPRSRHGRDFMETKRKGVAAHRREPTRDTGAIAPEGEGT